MSIYSDPPDYRDFRYDKPTLLVCWWATALCACIIVLRLVGRFVRTERLFAEDRIAAAALVPLFLRMGCVHYILVNGTNNVDLRGIDLSADDLRRREIASGLVLLSRILYAATLWTLKNTILEFFRRLTDVTWERSYHRTLVIIRWLLLLTFAAVIISDLAECRPFAHYWQVLPDPGPRCRQGYAQLITTASCDILTDLLLVFFPIPIILRSRMTVKRKIQLTLLFSLSLGVVGVALYRVPHVIQERGRQQYRSLLASVELIFATAAANALVLGSFVRDRGIKKQKFRQSSIADSFDRRSDIRRPALHHQWGSDEDLVRDVGIAIDPELAGARATTATSASNHNAPNHRPATSTTTGVASTTAAGSSPAPGSDGRWDTTPSPTQGRRTSNADRSDDLLLSNDTSPRSTGANDPVFSSRRVSFFDVGGLLQQSSTANADLAADRHAEPSPSLPASSGGFRRGSTAILQDLGGLLGSPRSGVSSKKRKDSSASKAGAPASDSVDMGQVSPRKRDQTYNMHGNPDPVLQDPGGLLR